MRDVDCILKSVNKKGQHEHEFPPVGLAASLVGESFVMYMYDCVLTGSVFLWEFLWSQVGGKIRSLFATERQNNGY